MKNRFLFAAATLTLACPGCNRSRGPTWGKNTVSPGTIAATCQGEHEPYFILYLHSSVEDGALKTNPNTLDAFTGTFKMQDNSRLEFEYKLGNKTLQIGESVYELDQGAVFLCNSAKDVRQLHIDLKSNVYLNAESVRLAERHPDIRQFVDSTR
jgi:hypothetical protein